MITVFFQFVHFKYRELLLSVAISEAVVCGGLRDGVNGFLWVCVF